MVALVARMQTTDDTIRPFDWLTSAVSLQLLLRRTISQLPVDDHVVVAGNQISGEDVDNRRRVLHVGCGSSLMGELIVAEPTVSVVVNVDCDPPILQRMQDRWECQCRQENNSHDTPIVRCKQKSSMQFVLADFTEREALAKFDADSFDMVVDKSTLDCMLCTGTGAEGLLMETYRLLKSGGIYLVITFHHFDFMRPLLENLPGADWDVTCSTMNRQVEDLTVMGLASTDNATDAYDDRTCADDNSHPVDAPTIDGAARTWATGTFQTDETYRNTVNVLCCQKHQINRGNALDWDQVHSHVSKTNNQWYVRDNPMLTSDRESAILAAFGTKPRDLLSSYSLLFTDSEREHLDYEDFLEDWKAFQNHRASDGSPIPDEGTMTVANAIDFLNTMQ